MIQTTRAKSLALMYITGSDQIANTVWYAEWGVNLYQVNQPIMLSLLEFAYLWSITPMWAALMNKHRGIIYVNSLHASHRGKVNIDGYI